MERFFISTLCGVVLATCLSPARVVADAPPQAQAVLAQEARWLKAIVAGDRATVATILSEQPEFTHITSDGDLVYRAAELAAVRKEPFTMTPTEQTVDFFADGAAIVRGVNAIAQPNHPVERVRFTDVFVRENGHWKAVSAQETSTGAVQQS
ncbi:MAG TPA: nuclear transport factor 2 family protein [Candidatus Tumulicola sp.]|jgi:hypothetical protein